MAFCCMDYIPAKITGVWVQSSYIEPFNPASPADRAAVKSWAEKCVEWLESQREEPE